MASNFLAELQATMLASHGNVKIRTTADGVEVPLLESQTVSFPAGGSYGCGDPSEFEAFDVLSVLFYCTNRHLAPGEYTLMCSRNPRLRIIPTVSRAKLLAHLDGTAPSSGIFLLYYP